jgi:hypothetical protein
MLYQDATDRALDEDIYLDLNEAVRAGSTTARTSTTGDALCST